MGFYVTNHPNRSKRKPKTVAHSFLDENWRDYILNKPIDPQSLIPRPLDDEPQEYDPWGDAYDKMRDRFEEDNS